MRDRFPVRTVLHHGQSLQMHASRGLTIISARGTLDIAGATWLGERMVAPRQVLHEGEAHVVQSAGWLAIAAHGDAEVVCLEAEKRRPLLQRLLAPLAFLARWPGKQA